MKYSEKTFNSEVKYYSSKLKGKVKGKVVFIESDISNTKAFLSLAPLSRAVHDLGGDIHVSFSGKKHSNLPIIKEIWGTYREFQKGNKSEGTRAMRSFIDSVEKRTKTKGFGDIFREPEIYLTANEGGFMGAVNLESKMGLQNAPDGKSPLYAHLELEYKLGWHKWYKQDKVFKAAKRIWKEGYALKRNEIASIGFVLVSEKKKTELPLEDYLDSFSIAYAMMDAAKSLGAEVSMASSSDRFSVIAKPVRTVDMVTTIRGCEYDKDINEEVFLEFKKLSKALKLNRLRSATASFGIHARGYYGKHFFGESIGYPTPNRKTRWTTPGQMMLKDRYSPQTEFETRDPSMRYAITESIPLDVFIETCDVDYSKLRKRSEKIKRLMNKCEYVRIVGREINGYRTDFKVDLIGKTRREFTAQDSDVRSLVDKYYFKKSGIKSGTYANFPSGESFVTPERVHGTMIGDVVISIGGSYILDKNHPILLKFANGKYNVISAPPKILKIMKKEWKDSKKKLQDYEKNKSLPQQIIKIYKDNFFSIGEFAINTNPKAKLSNYLIVNEKIAGMIHLALGSGFEPDKKTMYHWDIVVDSPRQKLDIYGVDSKGKEYWVHKKGKFII